MADPLGAATARAELKAPATLQAPLFRSLLQGIDEDRRIVVLDLGAAQSRTIALFGRFRCRLEIVDLAAGLEALTALAETAAREQAVERLLPPPRAEPFDVVLCWDLMNYVDRSALAALMSGIARRCRPGALAHGLIVYLESRMPAQPGCYVPLEDCRLLNLAAAKTDRAAPRYSPEDLTTCMPDFSIERGRLLANGMQEFLFERRGSRPAQRPPGPRADRRARPQAPVSH